MQVRDAKAAQAFANAYAAEHLIVNTADAEDWLPHINNAGSVFLGR
jgi:histidinol dehydrogenase